MTKGIRSKKLTLALGTLVLLIWGWVALNIANSIETGDPLTSIGANSNLHRQFSEARNLYAFKKDVRDPFRYIRAHRKDSAKIAKLAKPAWTPPPFKLTGILTAGRNHTAMLEGVGGAVYFLKEKDTLSGMKIITINEKIVTYYYQKKKTDWVLEKE